MAGPLPPFSCRYSPQVPELLHQLGCTVVLSTYQAGKLIFLSAKDANTLVQLPRTFDKPMGIAEQPETRQLALACRAAVILFTNSPELATHYPTAPQRYDGLFFPRLTYHTGPIDIHDLRFGSEGRLFAVSTLFSSIVTLSPRYNFIPYWTPYFIDRIVAEDRCHLNGMAMRNGLPKYATAFNTGNTYQSWRNQVAETGVLLDLDTNEAIAHQLPMPHSPRMYGDQLFLLLSATGELVKMNVPSGNFESIIGLDGFVRGLARCQDYLFVGLSKLRKQSSSFGHLRVKTDQCGVAIVHLPTARLIGTIIYQNSVEEIYDVHILANQQRPNILNTQGTDHEFGLQLPTTTFWAQPRPTD